MEAPQATQPYPELPILILDPDDGIRQSLELLFAKAGLDNVVTTGDRQQASSIILAGGASIVLLDLTLTGEGDQSQLSEFKRKAPDIPIIAMTRATDPATIVACMRAGAVDYVVKPIDEVRLFVSVWNAIGSMEQRREAERFRRGILEGKLERPEAFAPIVTQDERMLAIFSYAESVARSRQPVLLMGETGTGKELFARAIHEASGRKGAFVAVNMGGLDDTMFSDSLFGHRKGAFTGADGQRAGLLKEAAGGTILLDEIGDLEQHSQIKLLRLLQENEYFPLGSDNPVRSEARVIAATTKDLRAASLAGEFRSDLYYRLQTHPIAIPPLRDRPGDLRSLIRGFLEKSSLALGQGPEGEEAEVCADAMARLLAGYSFPGNVRELESLVHDAVAGSRGGKLDLKSMQLRLGLDSAPKSPIIAQGKASSSASILPSVARTLDGGPIPTLEEVEHELIEIAIRRAGGNLSQAAISLGISRQTLYNKLKDRDKP